MSLEGGAGAQQELGGAGQGAHVLSALPPARLLPGHTGECPAQRHTRGRLQMCSSLKSLMQKIPLCTKKTPTLGSLALESQGCSWLVTALGPACWEPLRALCHPPGCLQGGYASRGPRSRWATPHSREQTLGLSWCCVLKNAASPAPVQNAFPPLCFVLGSAGQAGGGPFCKP